eukprot:8418094-Pyramimonas_sp.AAC.1
MRGLHTRFVGQRIFDYARRNVPVKNLYNAAVECTWKNKYSYPDINILLLSDSAAIYHGAHLANKKATLGARALFRM